MKVTYCLKNCLPQPNTNNNNLLSQNTCILVHKKPVIHIIKLFKIGQVN